jgi:hypothetical protein
MDETDRSADAQSLEARLDILQKAGLVMWGVRKLPPITPADRLEGEQTVADLLIADRESNFPV